MKKSLLVIHCADTYSHMNIDVETVRGWHKAKGWTDIGYAHFVKRDGTIQAGRDLDGDGDVSDEVGAHVSGFNAESIGICYAGGKGTNGHPQFNATPEQMASLQFLVDAYEVKFPGIKTVGHCDLPGGDKACPVFDVGAWRKTWK
jgi:N-acetylmuramoyl-L-alanine amidase